MKTRNLLQILFVPIVVLFVLGCPAPGGGGGGGGGGGTELDPAGAAKLVDEGIALMKSHDWDGALSKFSGAVLKDPNNGQAVVGYAALNLASIMVDSSIVTLARNKLGLADYPTSMNMVVNPNSWMENNDPEGTLFPRISGEMAYDGQFGTTPDGKIDPNERLYAFAAWFMTHNTGFNDLVKTVMNTLGARLDTGIASVKAVSDDMSFTLTWDMFFSTPPTSSQWPYLNGSPATIVIGKAELLGIAAGMEAVRGLTYLAQVYDLTLPLGDYWNAFNPGNGTGSNPPAASKPFSGTFLRLTSESASKLASAKASYLSAISDLTASANGLLSNRPGFSLSRDPIVGLFFQNVDDWNGFSRVTRTIKKFAAVIQTSITDSEVAYLPVSFTDTFDPDINPWPTSIVVGTSCGINFGAFFNTPLNLFTAVLELSTGTTPAGEASGEPVYYRWGTSDFVKVDGTYMSGFSNDFRTSNPALCIRIADATFGGTVPTANYPKDNPATGMKLELGFNESSPPNGTWETGEGIYNVAFYGQIEGVIDLNAYPSSYGSDPTAYYSTSQPIPDALLDQYLAPANQNPTYRGYLRDEMSHHPIFYGSAPSFFLKGSSVYAQFVPASLAWNSFAAKGTHGSVDSQDDMTSAGSLWWAGGMQIYNSLSH